MNDCIFCKIIRREIPANIVYEDTDTIAFLDHMPNNPGHTLVLPKKHLRNIFDVDGDTWAKVTNIVRMLAPKIRDAVGADGMRISMNNESAGGQDVFHLHMHLIPFFSQNPALFPKWQKASSEELAQVQEQIRKLI